MYKTTTTCGIRIIEELENNIMIRAGKENNLQHSDGTDAVWM
jgi:hypothetical protein